MASWQDIDFSPIANLGKTYQEAQQRANRERTLANLVPGPDGQIDYGAASTALLRAGDHQGAIMLSQLGQHNRQIALQERIHTPKYIEEAARATARGGTEAGPRTANVKLNDGTEVTLEKTATGFKPLNVPGATDVANNPFSYGKMNETESKDAGYANRMFGSEQVLRNKDLMAASQSIVDRAADRLLPGDIANKFVTSDKYQKYDQAARDFINATLRRESGAAISQSEFDNAYKQYLPRPGDSEENLKQKQNNRQATLASIAGGGGRSYKPPFSFDEKGNMVATGNANQGVKPAAAPAVTKDMVTTARADKDATLAEARQAIANGKDKAAIVRFLQKAGIDPSGL